MNLDLVDAAELVLDWVFDGHDILARIVNGVEGGIQSSGLTRTCRTSHENHSPGGADLGFKSGQHLGVHPEIRKIEHQIAAVENTDHNLFPKDGRASGDTKVDGATLDCDLEATVLRKSDVPQCRGRS